MRAVRAAGCQPANHTALFNVQTPASIAKPAQGRGGDVGEDVEVDLVAGDAAVIEIEGLEGLPAAVCPSNSGRR